MRGMIWTVFSLMVFRLMQLADRARTHEVEMKFVEDLGSDRLLRFVLLAPSLDVMALFVLGSEGGGKCDEECNKTQKAPTK